MLNLEGEKIYPPGTRGHRKFINSHSRFLPHPDDAFRIDLAKYLSQRLPSPQIGAEVKEDLALRVRGRASRRGRWSVAVYAVVNLGVRIATKVGRHQPPGQASLLPPPLGQGDAPIGRGGVRSLVDVAEALAVPDEDDPVDSGEDVLSGRRLRSDVAAGGRHSSVAVAVRPSAPLMT